VAVGGINREEGLAGCEASPLLSRLLEPPTTQKDTLGNVDVPFGAVLAPWNYAALSGVESTVQR
jgi:hypothetical protein